MLQHTYSTIEPSHYRHTIGRMCNVVIPGA